MRSNNDKFWWLPWLDSLSVANLIVMPFWLSIFVVIGTPLDTQYLSNIYFQSGVPTHVDLLAALMLTALLAIVLWGVFFRRASYSEIGVTIIGIISLTIAANSVRIYFLSWLDMGWAKANLPLFAGLGLGVMVAGWVWRRQILTLTPRVIRICAPLFFLVLINVGIAIDKLNPERLFEYPQVVGAAPKPEKSAANRVVWIIFDELDERVAFRDRPKEVEMPALDRFRNESTVATNTKPPGYSTVYSIPSLMIGRRVSSASYPGRYDLSLHFDDGKKMAWTDVPGILHQARSEHMDVALLAQTGHPYCRQFGELLGRCWQYNNTWRPEVRSVWNRIDDVAAVVLLQLPLMQRLFVPAAMPLHNISSAHQYISFLKAAKEVLVNPDFELVFLHWNLPHWPFFYDHVANGFSTFENSGFNNAAGYLGNLELTDLAFAGMRRAMEQAGLWEDTAVIVSADHVWRRAKILDGVKSTTVPMMVKLPRQKQGHVIDKPMDAVNSRNLIWGLLTGTISNADQVGKALAMLD